jgi:hypothetical protein
MADKDKVSLLDRFYPVRDAETVFAEHLGTCKQGESAFDALNERATNDSRVTWAQLMQSAKMQADFYKAENIRRDKMSRL